MTEESVYFRAYLCINQLESVMKEIFGECDFELNIIHRGDRTDCIISVPVALPGNRRVPFEWVTLSSVDPRSTLYNLKKLLEGEDFETGVLNIPESYDHWQGKIAEL